MGCAPEELRRVPLFALLDEEEAAILAAQVEVRTFAARQRIYRIGDVDGKAYVVMSGLVRVTSIDDDQQEVVIEECGQGRMFGFASMMEGVPHMTNAMAVEASECLEVDRGDIEVLLERKPMAGMEMLTVQSKQIHAAQQLVRVRANRNPNDLIEEEMTFGERIADEVAKFGGSWTFIVLFLMVLVGYAGTNVLLKGRAWDPYPFILLNLFLSMLAAIQAPVIMMSQNRQDARDRVRSELDYEVNRRAEMEIQALAARLTLLTDKVDDLLAHGAATRDGGSVKGTRP